MVTVGWDKSEGILVRYVFEGKSVFLGRLLSESR